jgi:uroporphyrinogen-III decarboxylase
MEEIAGMSIDPSASLLYHSADKEHYDMTLRERIETVFAGGIPDAMAWFADLTYWYGTHEQIGDLPERWQGERGIGRIYRDYNVGEYVPGCCAFRTIDDKVSIQSERVDDSLAIYRWETPVGSLQAVQQLCPTAYCWGCIEHAVKTVEDLRVLRYIYENRTYAPTPEAIERIEAECGDFGLPVVAVPASPISSLNKDWAGVMTLCYLMADAPDEVEATLQVIGESQNEIWRITEQCACDYVMICENLSGETMGGFFTSHIGPYLTERVAGLHARGKKAIIHIDGTQHGVLDKVAATGIDCIDALTPAPVGDVALDEIRGIAGDDILILGGLPGAMFAPPFTRDDLKKHVLDIIRLHKGTGRFMLGVADQVPPDGDITLIKMVSELVEEFGRYD